MPDLDLEAFVTAMPRAEVVTRELDVSWIQDLADGEVVFVFREPSVAETFSVPGTMAKIARQFPKWPDTLLSCVATMALCHVAPKASRMETWLLYANLAERAGPAKFIRAMREFNELFPHLADLQGAAEQRRRTLTQEEYDKIRLCVTYLHRMPTELPDLVASALVDLRAFEIVNEEAKA